MDVEGPCSKLLCFGFSRLKQVCCLLTLLMADCGEMPKFLTHFALKFSHRTLKSFCMYCVTTSGTCVRLCFQLPEIKGFPRHLKFCGPVVLQFLLWGLFPVGVVSGWKFCALMSHQLNLCHWEVSCYLSNVFGSGFGTLHFLRQLSDLTGRKFLDIDISFIYSCGHKILIFHKKPEDISV